MIIGLIIPAAGSGKRFGGTVKKQYLELGGEPILIRTLKRFSGFKEIHQRICVVPKADLDDTAALLKRYGLEGSITLAEGGEERYHSVYNGLCALDPSVTHVLIHDGARPLLSLDLIVRSIAALVDGEGFTTAIPSRDTIKRVERDQVLETLDRSGLVLVQTPQGFDKAVLMRCYENMDFSDLKVTDDASVLECFGIPVRVIAGEETNLKLTHPIDLCFGEAILKSRGEETCGLE